MPEGSGGTGRETLWSQASPDATVTADFSVHSLTDPKLAQSLSTGLGLVQAKPENLVQLFTPFHLNLLFWIKM